jgi:hypothetical protein
MYKILETSVRESYYDYCKFEFHIQPIVISYIYMEFFSVNFEAKSEISIPWTNSWVHELPYFDDFALSNMYLDY